MNKIVILDGYAIDAGEKEIAELGRYGKVECYAHTEPDQMMGRMENAEAVFVDSQVLTKEVLIQCPRLKYIGIMATGTNKVDLGYAAMKGIAVCNVPEYSKDTVAQHAFALLLSLTNHLKSHQEFVSMGHWSGKEERYFWDMPHMELAGKNAGVFGYAAIGRRFTSIARGFGMNVLVNTGYPVYEEERNDLHFVSREELLEKSDVITLHKPMDAQNKEMINREAFERMKDGAILINTARGGLVDEGALIEALKSGKLRGAALDVLAKEPPEPDNPLLSMDNCIVTPHIAWTGIEARERLRRVTLDNFRAWLAGEIKNRVER